MAIYLIHTLQTFDYWDAWCGDDGFGSAPTGRGSTEQDAVRDLIERVGLTPIPSDAEVTVHKP